MTNSIIRHPFEAEVNKQRRRPVQSRYSVRFALAMPPNTPTPLYSPQNIDPPNDTRSSTKSLVPDNSGLVIDE